VQREVLHVPTVKFWVGLAALFIIEGTGGQPFFL
jgi:hypothetical protein